MTVMTILHVWLYYILAPYWTITAFLFILTHYFPSPKIAQTAGFGARSLCFIAGLTTCCILGVPESALLKLVGEGGLSQWLAGRTFKWIMYPLVGIWFDVDEESRKRLDSTRPAVFLANHQT
jgi:lysophosphatidate acyltransferase